MLNSPPPSGSPERHEDEVDRIVAAGPKGALVVAGIATAIVIALWFAFYLMVFLPRAAP